jgi:PTH1 family peptidyl-tRNA hydrolase
MQEKTAIKSIIGLGNPEKKYEKTYHNVGILFVEKNKKSLVPSFQCLVSNTHMNESGLFVIEQMKNTNLKPENLLIAHDDSDLKIGEYKLDFGRSAAGHHGVESVISSLGTKEFWRLRVGIRPQNEEVRAKAEEFVLKKISAEDKKLLEGVFEKAKLELWNRFSDFSSPNS